MEKFSSPCARLSTNRTPPASTGTQMSISFAKPTVNGKPRGRVPLAKRRYSIGDLSSTASARLVWSSTARVAEVTRAKTRRISQLASSAQSLHRR